MHPDGMPLHDEATRLQQLCDLLVLDTPPEAVFDSLAQMASQLCGAPIALLTLVDAERQWFKANVGLPGVGQTPRAVAFCAHAIQGADLFEVPDAAGDDRFAHNPLVTGAPGIRFYAGVPLALPEGARVGTLCVIDREPRRLTPQQAVLLRQLAQVATQTLTMRRDLLQASLSVRTAYERRLADSESLLRRAGRLAGVGGWELDLASEQVRWTEQTRLIHELEPDAVPTRDSALAHYPPEAQQALSAAVAQALNAGTGWDLELPFVTAKGRAIWVRAVGEVEREAGRPVRLVGVLQDITDARAARLELARLNREQHAMLDNDVVAIVKVRGRAAVWHNRALCHLFGYASDELARHATRLLYADDATYERVGAEAYPLLRQGLHYRTQAQMRRKDGRLIWVDMNGMMLTPETDETLWMFTDITAMKQHQEQVEHIAFHDSLTGLPNRLLLADRLKSALALSHRLARGVAVCVIDLDGFKAVNDHHGHDVGDRLLRSVADRLSACVRESDTVARLGGDEFVLVLTPLAGADEGLGVLDRVSRALRRPVDLGPGRQAQVSSSIGVALHPEHGATPADLLRRADEAMYRAKRQGKNQVVVHGSPAAAAPQPDDGLAGSPRH